MTALIRELRYEITLSRRNQHEMVPLTAEERLTALEVERDDLRYYLECALGIGLFLIIVAFLRSR